MKKILATEAAPGAIGPYSQGIVANGMLFVSGQLGLNPETGDFAVGGVEAQTEQSLKNLKAILEAAGCGMEDVVKTTVLLQNMADFAAVNAIYARYFPENCPARSAFAVAALPKGGLVEIEAIAVQK